MDLAPFRGPDSYQEGVKGGRSNGGNDSEVKIITGDSLFHKDMEQPYTFYIYAGWHSSVEAL
jgi:hypothetical protein